MPPTAPPRAKLHFRQIEVFHAVISAGSVSAAARLLNTSQPSLSRTIRHLEDMLRIPLFTRRNGKLVPTFEALELFAESDRIMRQVAELDRQIDKIAGGETRIFRLGASPSVCRRLVPRAIKALSVQKPDLRIFLDSLAQAQMTEYLVTGRGECVVTILPLTHPLIETARLGSGHLRALVPADHPLARLDILSVGDLADIDMIGFEGNGPHASAADQFLAPLKQRPRIRALVRFSDAAMVLVDEGLGVALVDSFSLQGPIGSNVVVRPVVDAPIFPLYVHSNVERPRSQHIPSFTHALEQAAKSMP